ncbi:MAG: hypothetical protein H0T44_14320 [Gemmatimonadales bacterium]|nr:hypothetical protein [Gemmatimonadales bacterium]MDQ3426631.1 hypothetical protein [Gemmatimonadota bacterium]
MSKPCLMLALLLTAGAPPVYAQTDYYARAGAVGASNLLRDIIVSANTASEITVRQSIAPMVALGGSVAIAPRYRAGLEATLASGSYQSEESGVEADLGTLRTGSLMLGLEGPIAGDFRWRAGLGALLYLPSEETGIFLSGGATRWLAGAGADYRRPLLSSWDLMASMRYDFHRFTTGELERRDFSQAQGVSRISLSVGLARGLR